MNKVILMGRITKDLELKRTNSDLPVCQFTVAVNRAYKSQSGETQADFINCVAWRKTAEVVSQYFKKGHRILIEGNLQTRTYDDKNGVKHYITEIVVEKVYFVETKADLGGQNNSYQKPQNQMPNQNMGSDNPFDISPDDFDVSSDDLPF